MSTAISPGTSTARPARQGRAITGSAAEPSAQGLRRWRWPVWWVLPAAAGLLTGLITLALTGAALDDVKINDRTGHATAQVLAVTAMRTLVQFAGPDGKVYRPDEGLAYPAGLRAGQLVRVEYDSAHPDRVRVAGRTWRQGVRPASLTLIALWALVAPVTWWLHRRRPLVWPGR